MNASSASMDDISPIYEISITTIIMDCIFVCYSCFFSAILFHRIMLLELYLLPYLLPTGSVDDFDELEPFLQKSSALTYLQKRNTYKGIVCECCVHRCNLQEIDGYCMPSPKRSSADSFHYMNL